VKINYLDIDRVTFLSISNHNLAHSFFGKSTAIMNDQPKIMAFDKRVKNFDIDITMSSRRG
jgi:hypothetical protein